jgi:hypothetical protein
MAGNAAGNVASSGAIIGDPRPFGDDRNPTGPAQYLPDGTKRW